MKRFSFSRLLLAVLLAAGSIGLGAFSYQVGKYFDFQDAYSGHIARGDESAAREGLEDLRYFHEQNRKLDTVWLSWLGDGYLFQDAACQRAAFYNLTKDYEKTVTELREGNDFCASFLRGVARWRQAQAIYANGLNIKDKAEQERQLKLADEMAATLAKDDFETALKANPGHAASSWNYDMLSDPDARAAGLMPKPGAVKIRLGRQPAGGLEGEGPQGEDDEKGEGKKTKDLDTNEEGPGRPDGKPRKVG